MSVSTSTPQYLTFLIPIAVIAMIILRNRRERRLRVEMMWILPVLILFGAASALYFAPGPRPGPVAIAALTGVLALGSAVGWMRGRTIRLQRDPATGHLMAQASPIGMILIVAVFALRQGLRIYAEANPEALHVNATLLTDGFLLFAVGLIIAQRVELILRARKLPALPAAA